MREESGKPALGETATTLGVRVPTDIAPDKEENVHPGAHGMSVSPSLETLFFAVVPKRLRHCVKGARGSNNARIWKMGAGPWREETVATDLRLELDAEKADKHGFVSPDRSMSLPVYREALAATQNSWSLIEEPPAP